jgi:3-deoxy-manno-octulosonate cytidylyltransferase (CMP-KDO synthetase)
MTKTAIGIIPARYGSTRFPGKPLIDIQGKSMIQRVYEQAKKVSSLSKVIVATDDQRIYDAVIAFGGEVVMTSENHQSGTDRCKEALNNSGGSFDVVVNIQGDEPFIDPEQIAQVVQAFADENTEIATLVKLIEDSEELFNPNKPKVLIDENDFAIYFSRAVLPYQRGVEQIDWIENFNYYKHIGLYAYRSDVLDEITQISPSRLELAEGLEQLRWIENGYKIKVAITETESISIDAPEDLKQIL